MRHTLLGLLLALLLPAPAHGACVRTGDRVVARSSETVVTRRGSDAALRWHACVRRTGRRRLIETGHRGADSGAGGQRFRAAGRFVAYGWFSSDRYDQLEQVHVVDVVTGERTRSALYFPALPIHFVTAVAVDARGRAAFRLDAPLGDDAAEVRALVAGKEWVLDRRTRAAIGDVAIRGGEVVWRAGRAALAPEDRCAPPGGSGTREVAVGPSRACLRATGEQMTLGAAVADALGTFVAVRRGERAVEVIDVATRQSTGRPREAPCREPLARLDPAGGLKLRCGMGRWF